MRVAHINNANANTPSADDLGEVALQRNDWALVAFQDTRDAPRVRFERCRHARRNTRRAPRNRVGDRPRLQRWNVPNADSPTVAAAEEKAHRRRGDAEAAHRSDVPFVRAVLALRFSPVRRLPSCFRRSLRRARRRAAGRRRRCGRRLRAAPQQRSRRRRPHHHHPAAALASVRRDGALAAQLHRRNPPPRKVGPDELPEAIKRIEQTKNR